MLTPPTPPNGAPTIAPRILDSKIRLNSSLVNASQLSATNFSAVILISSCAPSVIPSIAAPLATPALKLFNIDGLAPVFSNSFLITSCLRIGLFLRVFITTKCKF